MLPLRRNCHVPRHAVWTMTSDQQNASIGSTEGFPAGLHPQTARLVRDFALALAAKLLRAEKEYGYNIGWLTEEWESECRRDLLKHIAKGDPLDVAAFAAFMWRRGWSTTVPQAADIEAKTSGRWMFVPEGTREIALELAPSLDKLIDAVLAHSEGKSDVMYHSSLRAFLWDNKVGLLRVLQAHAPPPEVPFVDTTKLNAGQLVQRIMRVLDHNDSGAFGIAKLAEAVAAGILDLPSDYWHKPTPSPPEVREVTEEGLTGCIRKTACNHIIKLSKNDAAILARAILRLLAPSDQNVTGE